MPKRLMRRGQGLQTKLLGNAVSKWSDAAQRFVTSKQPVRRLMARDPARAITDPNATRLITNNPNLKYQPGGLTNNNNPRDISPSLPGAKKVRRPNPSATKSSTSGHDKVIRRVPKKVEKRDL